MSFTGIFEWYTSGRAGGTRRISFVLRCDNLMQSETFDCAIMPGGGGAQPMVFRQLKLKARQALRFDLDTVDWNWCDGDSFAILGATTMCGSNVRCGCSRMRRASARSAMARISAALVRDVATTGPPA